MYGQSPNFCSVSHATEKGKYGIGIGRLGHTIAGLADNNRNRHMVST